MGEGRFNIDYMQYAKKDVVVNNLMEGKSLLNQSIWCKENLYFDKSCLSLEGFFVLRVMISDKYTYSQRLLIICLFNLLTIGVQDECFRIHSCSYNTVVSNHVNSDHVRPSFSCLDVWTPWQTTSGVYAITVTMSAYHSCRCGRL